LASASVRSTRRLPRPDRDLPRLRRPELRARGDRDGRGLPLVELTTKHGWGFYPALVAGVISPRSYGALTHFYHAAARQAAPLMAYRHASTAHLAPGDRGPAPTSRRRVHAPELPTKAGQDPRDDRHPAADRLILLAIAAVVTALCGLCTATPRFGLATSAVARNRARGIFARLVARRDRDVQLGARLAAWPAWRRFSSSDRHPAGRPYSPTSCWPRPRLALVAQFRRIPVAFAAGLVVASPRRGNPLRPPARRRYRGPVHRHRRLAGHPRPGAAAARYLLQRLPTIGTGRIHWPGLAFAVAVCAYFMATTTPLWIDALTVTGHDGDHPPVDRPADGYAGQLSLGAVRLRGFGAWVAGRLLANHEHMPLLLGMAIGVAATLPLASSSDSGDTHARINLAIVTSARHRARAHPVQQHRLHRRLRRHHPAVDQGVRDRHRRHRRTRRATGCLADLPGAGRPRGGQHPARALGQAADRRAHERAAAAALGINVAGAKFYAFAMSAAIAGLGGIPVRLPEARRSRTRFDAFTSITMVAFAMIGGIGYLFGAWSARRWRRAR